LSNLVPEYLQVNTLLQAIFKMYTIRFDIYTVKQPEVVTSTSPEIFNQ